MLFILPAVVIALYKYFKCKTKETAEALARTILIFELLLLGINNLLSFFHALNRYMVLFSWLLVFFVTMVLYGKNREPGVPKLQKPDINGVDLWSRPLRIIMLAILLVLSVVLLAGQFLRCLTIMIPCPIIWRGWDTGWTIKAFPIIFAILTDRFILLYWQNIIFCILCFLEEAIRLLISAIYLYVCSGIFYLQKCQTAWNKPYLLFVWRIRIYDDAPYNFPVHYHPE